MEIQHSQEFVDLIVISDMQISTLILGVNIKPKPELEAAPVAG